MESFVYCWTDWATEKLYVGYHKGSAHDGYVCSSKWMMAEYTRRPQDFTRQILATGSAEDMYKFETAILKSAKAKTNKYFYNLSENNPPPRGNTKTGRIPWNKGLKGVQTAWNKGLPKEEQPKYGKPGGMAGKKQSEYQKTVARKTAQKLNNKILNESHKCPHCDYEGYYTTRWHWDGCKHKV